MVGPLQFKKCVSAQNPVVVIQLAMHSRARKWRAVRSHPMMKIKAHSMLKSMAKLASIVGDVKIKLLNFVKGNVAFPGCHSPGREGGNLKQQIRAPGKVQWNS